MKATEFSRPKASKPVAKTRAKVQEFQAPPATDTNLHRVQAELGIAGDPAVTPATSKLSAPASAVASTPAGPVSVSENPGSPYGLDSEQNAEWLRIRDGGDPELLNAIMNWN